MDYCADTDIFLAFGESNVRKWADVNNNGLKSEIDKRIAWSISNATAHLNSKLHKSRYQFPLSDDSDIPADLTLIASFKAGVLLYESRGITDMGPDGKAVHSLSWHRDQVEEFIRDIHSRRRFLIGVTLKDGAVADISEAPAMVCFPDPSKADSVTKLEDNMIDIAPRQ